MGPLAARWVDELHAWYAKLQTFFKFDPSNLPANLKCNIHKWSKRLQYLLPDQNELFDAIIGNVEKGHKIPFGDKVSGAFFRGRNPPSLAKDKTGSGLPSGRTWPTGPWCPWISQRTASRGVCAP